MLHSLRENKIKSKGWINGVMGGKEKKYTGKQEITICNEQMNETSTFVPHL